MAVLKVKITDWQNTQEPFILPENDEYIVHPFARAGVNIFVKVTDGFESKVLVNNQSVGIPDDIPANFQLLVGRVVGKAIGLPFSDDEYDEE